jgi:hypothetical protein
MKNNLKSAVAFFFLFFLHGTSIGNGKQGISYNVSGLCVRWGFPALKPIDSTNFNLSTNDYR